MDAIAVLKFIPPIHLRCCITALLVRRNSITAKVGCKAGPTGSGKTRVVEAMAESLFGDAHACLKIDCAEFLHSHEIAKLS